MIETKNDKVLVIGDIILDRYVYGIVERISPEAPVPVLNYHEEKEDLGGVGVVLDSLTRLGVETTIISVIGNDEAGEKIRELCKKNGLETDGIVTETGRVTTVKTRFVSTSPFWQNILRLDKEKIDDISNETQEEIIQKIKEKTQNCDLVVVSDYKKGLMSDKVIKGVIEETKKQKKQLIVDTKGKIFEYIGATIIAPNRKELCDNFYHKATKNIDIIKTFAKELAKKMDCDVVVKLGEDGVLLINKLSELLLQTEAKKIVNVSGAGDVFIAIMVMALARGKTIEDAVRLANKGAGIAVGKAIPRIAIDEL